MVQSCRAMVMAVMVIVMGEATIGRSPPLCPDVACSKEYRPLCGSDGRTYGNRCRFNSARCTNPSLSVAHLGECGNCPKPCTTQYAPVCGSDGNTYGNLCFLDAERECHNPHLAFVHAGVCQEVTHAVCADVACPEVFRPVCGSDYTTYRNKCHYDSVKCTNHYLSVVHLGECGECPKPCTKEYSPVCGSDGRTYGNRCLLESEKECNNPDLTLSHVGSCGGDGKWWKWQ